MVNFAIILCLLYSAYWKYLIRKFSDFVISPNGEKAAKFSAMKSEIDEISFHGTYKQRYSVMPS